MASIWQNFELIVFELTVYFNIEMIGKMQRFELSGSLN